MPAAGPIAADTGRVAVTVAPMTRPDGAADDPLRSARLLHEAGRIVAGWPRVHERLWRAHQPDAGGRCRACSSQTRAAPVWPCALAVLAQVGAAHQQPHTL